MKKAFASPPLQGVKRLAYYNVRREYSHHQHQQQQQSSIPTTTIPSLSGWKEYPRRCFSSSTSSKSSASSSPSKSSATVTKLSYADRRRRFGTSRNNNDVDPKDTASKVVVNGTSSSSSHANGVNGMNGMHTTTGEHLNGSSNTEYETQIDSNLFPDDVERRSPPTSNTTMASTSSPRSGPIPMNRTPRRNASKRVRPANPCSVKPLNGGGTNGSSTSNSFHDPGALNGSSSSAGGFSGGLQTFVNGGTPCDPAPPPFHLAKYGEESLYTLVLLRHGESEWNHQNRYTGWCDVNLTKTGEMEARTAGRLLYENKIEIDHAFTSLLKRASFSCNMALNMAKQHWVPVTKTWRLNERHYGALQGYHKDTAYQELGLDQELVMQMRRSYDVQPPRMEDDHPYWHGGDRRYGKLTPEQLERTRAESLKDVADRIMPFYNQVIKPSLRAGNKCLIVSHANTVRTLIKHIDGISDQEIKGMTIPTGVPMLYRLDKNMTPVDPQIELEFRYMVEPKGYTWGTSRAHGFHGVYLGDLARLQDIQLKRDKVNRDWQRIILKNVGKEVGWTVESDESGPPLTCTGPKAVETRQLWWHIHNKMQNPDYGNMLLLMKMETQLEDLMLRKQKYITRNAYEKMCNKIHLDAAGQIVEPFVAMAERHDFEQRQRAWYEMMSLDMEEECLIK